MFLLDLGIDKQFTETIEHVRKAINHLPKNSIPAAFQDAINVLYSKQDLKPFIIDQQLLTVNGVPYKAEKKSMFQRLKDLKNFIVKFFGKEPLVTNKNETWFFVIHLPPGIEVSDFIGHQQVFADAIGGSCHIEKRGKAIHVWLSSLQLEVKYKYKYDPVKYVDKENYLPVPFGISSRGPIVKDITDTHWFLAGETRYGKSNLIHCMIYSLLLINATTTSEVFVCIIDLKEIEFPEFDEWVWRETSLAGTYVMLEAILQLIQQRNKIFARARVRKIQDYLYKGNQMPFVVVVIDELHKLKDKECLEMLQTILAVGAGYGILVIASTQRPSSTIFEKVKFGDLKANFDGKVSFRASTKADSMIILDNPVASYLPNIKGRAIFQWDLEVEVQTLYFPLHPKEEKQLQELLSQLDPPRFIVRSEPCDIKRQKGILPRSVNTLPPGAAYLLGHRTNPPPGLPGARER